MFSIGEKVIFHYYGSNYYLATVVEIVPENTFTDYLLKIPGFECGHSCNGKYKEPIYYYVNKHQVSPVGREMVAYYLNRKEEKIW